VVPGLDVIACTYCGHWSQTNPPSFDEVARRHNEGLTCNLPPWVAPDPALAAAEDKAAKEAAEAAGGDGTGSYEISRSAWAAASAGEDCWVGLGFASGPSLTLPLTLTLTLTLTPTR